MLSYIRKTFSVKYLGSSVLVLNFALASHHPLHFYVKVASGSGFVVASVGANCMLGCRCMCFIGIILHAL